MRFALGTTALAALFSALIAASCISNSEAFSVQYRVTAPGVPDIPGTCGGLWDNLKQFPDCIGVGLASCEPNENGDLFWTFSNGSGCNEGMVEAAWFDATQNQYGSLECEEEAE